MQRLYAARVLVFGVGGVGGYAVEAMARSGIGSFLLVDNDCVAESNINRQIIATHETIGRYKVDVMAERIRQINPDASVEVRKCFFLPENADEFDFSQFSYVVDAVDTVTAKIEIILRAKQAGIPVISSMGAGNKIDPTMFEVTDIYKTQVCPLAKVMRRELKKRGVKELKVVYSRELARKPFAECKEDEADAQTPDGQKEGMGQKRRATPASIAFVPSVAGLIVAGEVIRDLTDLEIKR